MSPSSGGGRPAVGPWSVDAPPPFPALFSPITLRKITLRNRVVMLPMGSRFARDGKPTDGDFAFYRARAQSGVGLIITGGTPMHPSAAMRGRNAYEAFNQESIPAMTQLAEEIHREGAAVFGQLYHRGRETLGDSDWPTWAPSPIPASGDRQVPHQMTRSEIAEIVEAYGQSARNLRAAGFDGIEIHGAHGYLVAQFLSSQSNRRQDEYGGSPENRMRFLKEVIDAIRAFVDVDCVLGIRMSAEEGIEEGIKLGYSKEIAKALAATGKVDYLSVTIGVRGTYVKDMSVPVGPTIPLAAAIKKASGLPVIAGQRINHPNLAEQAISTGAADMVGMARALIADWDWVAKAREGRLGEIRPCIACVQDCRSGGMACVHSPTAGRELIWGPGSLKRATHGRKVVVVGGGPAGMEAAIQAAERGHEVVLFEAGAALGGQARIASLAPNRSEVGGVVAYRSAELGRLGVSTRLGITADLETVLTEAPDAVVIATGSLPAKPEVEGGTAAHVIDVLRVLEPDPSTERLLSSVKTAAVVDDGSGFWETCGAAEALAQRGINVNFVSPSGTIGASIPFEAVGSMNGRLHRLGVEFLPGHGVASIQSATLIVYDVHRVAAARPAKERYVAADVVVYYAGKRVVDGLARLLDGRVPEIHLVGDCVSPRRISQAVFDGHRVGRSL